LEGVSLVFNRGKENECVALDDINLTISAGEYVTIWGCNGAGKTSLIRAIADNKAISSGRVLLNGKDITKMSANERAKFIGIVTQNTSDMIAGSLTLEEHLKLGMLRGSNHSLKVAISPSERRQFESQLETLSLGLGKKLKEIVMGLSGGEKQAAILLMATANKPSVLLLDEHTASLDLEKTKSIERLTDSLIRDNNITTLWITHNKDQAAHYGDRILFMRKGRIIKDLKPSEKRVMSEIDLAKSLEDFQMEEISR